VDQALGAIKAEAKADVQADVKKVEKAATTVAHEATKLGSKLKHLF
jgi:hypothetical protein